MAVKVLVSGQPFVMDGGAETATPLSLCDTSDRIIGPILYHRAMRSDGETDADVCARKIAYATWSEAEDDARRLIQGTLAGIGGMMAPYRCGDHWHNGHMPWKAIRIAAHGKLRRGQAGAPIVRHPTGRID